MTRPISNAHSIHHIETTSDTLSGRGGLALFNRYLFQTGVLAILSGAFGHLRNSAKGLPIWQLFQQMICFFVDGTNHHLTHFDELKEDAGYAAAIETDPDDMASSHQIKRFIKSISIGCWPLFGRILLRLFVWRLRIEQPDVIELYLDSVVLDNDQAQKRHGNQPTHKKVKGFKPLQISWNGFTVAAWFRSGAKHCNYKNQGMKLVIKVAEYIRQHYRQDIPIIVRADAAFFDQDNFDEWNRHNIGFIATGKTYGFVKDHVQASAIETWGEYCNDHQFWKFQEFGYRCDAWSRFYRAFYTVPISDENGQLTFGFDRSERVILTNLGTNPTVLASLSEADRRHWLDPLTIIKSRHQCGADELSHRALKDFGAEALPFQRFIPNSVFYHTMLIAFFLFEAYKHDVLKDDVPGIAITSYATTVRRIAIDFAAKIVKTSHQIILKVTQAVMDRLSIQTLWERCLNPPPLLI